MIRFAKQGEPGQGPRGRGRPPQLDAHVAAYATNLRLAGLTYKEIAHRVGRSPTGGWIVRVLRAAPTPGRAPYGSLQSLETQKRAAMRREDCNTKKRIARLGQTSISVAGVEVYRVRVIHRSGPRGGRGCYVWTQAGVTHAQTGPLAFEAALAHRDALLAVFAQALALAPLAPSQTLANRSPA